jgi:hypothetical protein
MKKIKSLPLHLMVCMQPKTGMTRDYSDSVSAALTYKFENLHSLQMYLKGEAKCMCSSILLFLIHLKSGLFPVLFGSPYTSSTTIYY